MNEPGFAWRNFQVRVDLPIESLDHSFAIQAWCIDHLGGRWATTPPGVDHQEWYFVDEADATMFRLRWA